MRVLFGIFPLLSVPIIIYNILAFSRGRGDSNVIVENGVAVDLEASKHMLELLAKPMAHVPMVADGAVRERARPREVVRVS